MQRTYPLPEGDDLDRHVNDILIFRSKDDIARTSEILSEHGLSSVGFEAIETRCSDSNTMHTIEEMIPNYDYISFSSRECVRCVREHIPSAAFTKKRVLASGPSTANMLIAAGIDVAYAPDRGGIRSIIDWLSRMEPSTLLIIGSDASDNDISELVLKGFTVTEVVSHITIERDLVIPERYLREARYALFFSPSEVRAFRRSIRDILTEPIEGISAVCIGASTYVELTGLFRNVYIAGSNSIEGMVEILKGDINGQE